MSSNVAWADDTPGVQDDSGDQAQASDPGSGGAGRVIHVQRSPRVVMTSSSRPKSQWQSNQRCSPTEAADLLVVEPWLDTTSGDSSGSRHRLRRGQHHQLLAEAECRAVEQEACLQVGNLIVAAAEHSCWRSHHGSHVLGNDYEHPIT